VQVEGAVVGFAGCIGMNLEVFHRWSPALMTNCVIEEGSRLADMTTSVAVSFVGAFERNTGTTWPESSIENKEFFIVDYAHEEFSRVRQRFFQFVVGLPFLPSLDMGMRERVLHVANP